LRSGRFPLEHSEEYFMTHGNLKEALRAHALVAGITATELGITEEESEECLRLYLGKGDPERSYEAHLAHTEGLNGLFAAA